MRTFRAGVLLAAMAACAGPPGTAEDFKWSIDCPAAVDKGAEFQFVVKTADPAGHPVNEVRYSYLIQWTGGSSNPLRHKGYSGLPEKVRARMAPGPAALVVTCENRSGLDTKVLEHKFEVK